MSTISVAKRKSIPKNLAAVMITYPSTHGVFEEHIREICDIVHAPWRAGLSRRRQHERAGRAGAARRLRRRCLASQPAQDVLHPAWRRRPGHGPDRRKSASRAVSAGPSRDRRRHAASGRTGVGGAVRLGLDPDHLLHLHPDDGRRRTDARHRDRDPQRQLHRGTAAAAFPGAVPECKRPRCA